MKLTVKIFSLMLVITMLFAVIAPTVSSATMLSADKVKPNYAGNTTGIVNIAGRIIGLLRNISVVAGVLLLTVIGLKFMIGSAEEKAEYKKSLVPLVVGICVVMAATTITSLIFSFFDTKS